MVIWLRLRSATRLRLRSATKWSRCLSAVEGNFILIDSEYQGIRTISGVNLDISGTRAFVLSDVIATAIGINR